MVEFYMNVIYALTSLLSFISLSTATNTLKTQNKHADVIHHLDAVNTHLNALSRSIRSAHTDMTARQMEECQFMGAMSDTICDLLLMDNALGDGEAVNNIIHYTSAPGKRSEHVSLTDASKRKVMLEDLLQKRRLLENLNSVVDDASSRIATERKRSCNLNLGFHCQTEQYSAIADMYNWLQSSLSPGRRRKRAVNTQGNNRIHSVDNN